MGGRANREEIKHHQFAIVIPPSGNEAELRSPTHGKCLAAIQHPRPVDPVVKLCREVRDLRIVEVSPSSQYAAKKERRIDGRDLDIDERLSGLHVVEVIKETVFIRHLVEVKVERRGDLFFYPVRWIVASAVGDA